jgi:hypothetical protein
MGVPWRNVRDGEKPVHGVLDRDSDHEPIQDADVRESLQVFHSGDAANLRIARIGDGYSDADMENPEAYLRRGQVIGNIEWYGGHRGQTGWWNKLFYPNGADGRVASIYCDAEEDFGAKQAATISFATTRAGQSGVSRLATRMQIRHDGKVRLLEMGHDETTSSTNYGELWVQGNALYFQPKGGSVIRLAGSGTVTPPPTPTGSAMAWYTGSGFVDGWYVVSTGKYLGSDKSRPPSGYTIVTVAAGTKPVGF